MRVRRGQSDDDDGLGVVPLFADSLFDDESLFDDSVFDDESLLEEESVEEDESLDDELLEAELSLDEGFEVDPWSFL